jgi:hypothetical protein
MSICSNQWYADNNKATLEYLQLPWRNGTEQALLILRSAAVRSFQVLGQGNLEDVVCSHAKEKHIEPEQHRTVQLL